MTKDQADAHFASYYYEVGFREASAGMAFGPPLYNITDRAAYRAGFDDARKDL